MGVFNLDKKIAVITGGGSGIGKAISILFAKQGAEVHIIDLTQDEAASVVDQIKKEGGKATSHSCDISKQEQVQASFNAILKASSKVDILINNAGIAHVGNLLNTNADDLDRVYQVNVKGAFFCCQAAVQEMLKNGGGVVLNLASIASLIGLQDRFAYSISKGAILTMTYSIAKDYVSKNIRCNCICPARVHTPFVDGFLQKNYADKKEEMFKKLSEFQPVGRMAKPEEIAALALYLCSDEASFITGAAYPIDGGVLSLR